MFKKILVPVDGSRRSEQVIPLVEELLEGGAQEATFFRVGEAPKATMQRRKGSRRPVPLAMVGGASPSGLIPAVPPAYVETKGQAVERREHELLEYVDHVGRPLAESGGTIHAAVHFGEPANEIIELAKRGQFDLIVMATHGRSGLRRTLQGSVTAEVIRSGVTPVLVMRPKRRRAKTRP